MRTYAKFKTINKLEDYLLYTNNIINRFSISKLRLSNHKLKIETGRYENLPVEKRLCEHCQKIDDEFHFIIECSLFDNERNLLFHNISKVDDNFTSADRNNKFKIIFKSAKNICDEVGKFTNHCTRTKI